MVRCHAGVISAADNVGIRMRGVSGSMGNPLVALFACLLWTPFALADDASLPGNSIPAVLATMERHSVHGLPTLTESQFQKIESGQPLTIVRRAADKEVEDFGIYGFKVVEAPRLLVWTALLGGNRELDPRYSRATLRRQPGGSYTRYQHIDLPWPVRNRHWIIHSSKNVAIADATDGQVWQHHWQLIDNAAAEMAAAVGRFPEITERRLRKSILIGANEGAWSAVSLDEQRTLLVAYFDFDLGGRLPRSLLQSVSRKSLQKTMQRLAEKSAMVHLNYDKGPAIHDGHGRPITPREVAAAAQRFHGSETALTAN